MSTNELEGTPVRGAVDKRGSDDSDDGNPEERRGSEDSLAAEGISMEKQDVETKEKQSGLGVGGAKSPANVLSGRGGYSVVGGAGSSERRSKEQAEGRLSSGRGDKSPAASPEAIAGKVVGTDSSGQPDQDDVDEVSQGLPFVAPITLEVGEVMFAPAPPPVSTAMPLLRSRSKEGEDTEGEAPGIVVEDIHEQYFDAVQDSSMGLSESGGEKDRSGKRKHTEAEDADDEHVSSVSEGEEDHAENGAQNKLDRLGDDETFPLRTYSYGKFRTDEHAVPFRNRLEERRLRLSSGDRHSTSSAGHEDGASSVVSDGYSPRPHGLPPDKNVGLSEADERAAQSYSRFKASMPKFSSKAYSFSKRHPTSVTTSTSAPLTFDHSPLMSPGSQLYSANMTEDDATNEHAGPQGSAPPPPTPRPSYDDIKVDKSEGYYLDNYSDVLTWRLPSRDSSRPYLNGTLDNTLEELLGKLDEDEANTETNRLDEDSVIEDEENEEKINEDGGDANGNEEDDDDDRTEMEVKNKEDETRLKR
ncbi:LOW QUALITY PROTEIN: hypothetical protein ElyMa_006531700 [Elysia marginata]|uniref:Uncharacterized protein n=1 Tax=Elysia marginata TaxID=1093978 RepID=A0AAV4I7L9_9GAST|nr:LOW QUALITY PROTEIN: hypothetical protein ElyMa_006531700 [Elysia marginata]